MTQRFPHSARKKYAEAHARVLGVVAGDQLGLGLGQVERRAVSLGQQRREEDEEGDEARRVVWNMNQFQGSRPARG